MRLFIPSFAVLASVLAGCTPAEAITPDASNDVDCSVIAFYFNREAARLGVPEDQQRATAAVHAWYSKRVHEIEAERGLQAIEKRADPLLVRLNRDPASMLPASSACAERAVRAGLR